MKYTLQNCCDNAMDDNWPCIAELYKTMVNKFTLFLDLPLLQRSYQPHLSDKARCSEASRFPITKIWYA